MNEVSEKPILFSAPMVRAVMREVSPKTVTRRIVKVQPHGAGSWVRFGDLFHFPNICPHTIIKSPYGLDGDLLWVRETFRGAAGYDGFPPSKWGNKPIWYPADGTPSGAEWFHLSDKCKPGIHMPRWASRLTLEITDIRVERLQDITEADAIAEGVEKNAIVPAEWRPEDGYRHYGFPPDYQGEGYEYCATARESFRTLWESINGPGSWDGNPWVWAVSFRRRD